MREVSMVQRTCILFGFLATTSLLLANIDARAATAAGDRIFTDGFDAAPGVLLEGPPESPAMDALIEMPPVPAPAADLDDGVILTRMDLFIDREATVGEINTALIANGALIVTMSPDHATLTVSIPRASGRPALRKIRDAFKASAGILMAALAEPVVETALPDPPAGDVDAIGYLYSSRFPAAWNVGRLASRNCESRKVPIRFFDFFEPLPAGLQQQFDDQIPLYSLVGVSSLASPHGYEVVMTAASRFDQNIQTGANPFPQCLKIEGISGEQFSLVQLALLAGQGDSSEKALRNFSVGTRPPCWNVCHPWDFDTSLAATYAMNAIAWRSDTRSSDASVLFVSAGGNDRDSRLATLYPFFQYADFGNAINMSWSLDVLGTDGNSNDDDFAFLGDGALLDSTDPAFPSLRASPEDIARVKRFAAQNLPAPALPATNVLVVGSASNGREVAQLHESTFSKSGVSIHAVGEQVMTFADPAAAGTSFATPQLTGLASYLWLLSDALRQAPVERTIEAITTNAQFGEGVALVDAYASVLSLDSADPADLVPSAETMPIRLALLDLDEDGRFTETDVSAFAARLLLDGGGEQQDWSRYDLNGDGYTGGFHADRFDLDRVGSTQFAAARYSTVSETMDGLARSFDETMLLDIDILCYYAYSPLYTGGAAARTSIIGAACADPFGEHDELELGPGILLKNGFSGGGSGYVYASSYAFNYLPTVQRFSFATMGWGAPTRLVPDTDPDYRVVGFAANPHDAVALLGFSDPAPPLKSRAYDPPTDSWSQDVFIDVSAAPRFAPSNLDPAFALSANGSAVTAWVAGGADTQRNIVASRFDPLTQQWSPPEVVVEGLSGPLTTRPFALADDSGNFYVGAYARSGAPAIYRFDSRAGTWSRMEAFPGDFIYSLGVDPSGGLLAVGGANGGAMSSRNDPVTGHWSASMALPIQSVVDLGALSSDVPIARYGGGSEGCQIRLLCIDARGNVIVLLPVAPIDGPNAPVTLGAFRFDAGSSEWRSLGEIGRGTSFSIGMGYQSGNADIAWATDTYGSFYVRHVDVRNGMEPSRMFFRSSPAHYFLVAPSILHDEGDAAIAVWGSAPSGSGGLVYYWTPVH